MVTQEGLIDVTINRQPSNFGHEGDEITQTEGMNEDAPKVITKILRTSNTAVFNPHATSERKATIRVINPHYRRNGNPEQMTHIIRGDPTIGATVENPAKCVTEIPVPGYHNFLSDPVFVRNHHEVVNGKILRWRAETYNSEEK